MNERQLPDEHKANAPQQDAEAVAELVAQLGYQRTPEQVRLWIRGLGSRPEQAAFVAELDGEIVAWIDVSLERRLQSEVFGLIGGLVVRDGLRSRASAGACAKRPRIGRAGRE